MTARTVVAASSLAVALASAGCLSFYEIAVETPIQAKIDVSSFQRVLIAGFLTGGSKSIDPNTETARLLRSQLRSKSDLRVIDAEVLLLGEEMEKRRGTPAPSPSPAAATARTERDVVADEGVAALEAQVGDEAHPGSPERRPVGVVGCNPAEVRISRERVNPDVDHRRQVRAQGVTEHVPSVPGPRIRGQ